MTVGQWENIQTEPETPNRDKFGRPLVIPPEGGKSEAYTRCTTFVDVIEDKYNLQKWQQRQVAAGIAQRQDLQLRAATLGLQPSDPSAVKQWRKDMDEVTQAATEAAQAHAAANIGTSIHALAEQIDRGQQVGVVPEQYKPHLDAYREATEGFQPELIERFTVNDMYKIGGTPDRITRIPGHDKLVVADIKTGNIEFGVLKMAMQLAVYSRSQMYNIETGERTSLGDIDPDWGLIIGLSATTGKCQLHWIDIATGWDLVKTASDVRAARKLRNLTEPYTEVQANIPSGTSASQPHTLANITKDTNFLKVIRDAATPSELYEIWRQAEQQNLWTDELTNHAAKRKQQLEKRTV